MAERVGIELTSTRKTGRQRFEDREGHQGTHHFRLVPVTSNVDTCAARDFWPAEARGASARAQAYPAWIFFSLNGELKAQGARTAKRSRNRLRSARARKRELEGS